MFYKFIDKEHGMAVAPNFVYSPTFTLNKEDYELLDRDNPKELEKLETANDGWLWFDNETDAYIHFEQTVMGNTSITPLQTKLAFESAGKLDSIETFIKTTSKENRITWENALEFKQDSPLILALKTSLGMSDEELDDLFSSARLIDKG